MTAWTDQTDGRWKLLGLRNREKMTLGLLSGYLTVLVHKTEKYDGEKKQERIIISRSQQKIQAKL